MKKLIASILIVLLMIPTVAFAESTHTLSKLDLTASGHSDKTLETDGGSKNPATGDSGVVLYIAIAVVAVGGAAAVIVCRNKKKDN